jgi:hypothetical protein
MRDATINGEIQIDAEGQRLSNGDQLDKAGQSILRLLHKAAGVAEENSRQALDTAQKLSHQLRATEDRIAELEAEAEAYRDRAERAEQWLHKVYTEIDDRFLRQKSELPSDGAPQFARSMSIRPKLGAPFAAPFFFAGVHQQCEATLRAGTVPTMPGRSP